MRHRETVLIIGRHADLLAKITGMLKQNGYNAIGRISNEEAILTFKTITIDAVVIGGGVDQASRDLFQSEFPKINPKVKIINAHPQTVLAELKSALTANL